MTIFRTVVQELPATPLGLLPACWVIEHWCATCRERVASAELLAHAQTHERCIKQEGDTIE
jgi:hypothetical protein